MEEKIENASETVQPESGNALLESQVNTQDARDSKKGKKKRANRVIPTLSYEESLTIANGIWQYASGQKIRRITLFDQIGKSPDSGPSRTLVTTSSKYGITIGGYQADYIELSPDGNIATNPDEIPSKKVEANFKLAIESNDYFAKLYNQYKDMKLPAKSVMIDFLRDQGLESDDCTSCVELFIINAKYIGLIRVIAGSERIISIEQLIEEMSINAKEAIVPKNEILDKKPKMTIESKPLASVTSNNDGDKWSRTCFYITPIGQEDSEERNHSDLFLNSIVEPALEEFGLNVVRADKISTPGMITSQIIEHIVNSKLVIADLSFHNPNVFYELSLRHTFNLPTIHLIRKSDYIPFDLNNFRTIVIDTTNIYTLVPQLETYRTSVAMQVRQLMESPDIMENPISAYMEKMGKSTKIKENK
ncbi:hypothetical protein [Dehalobacter sp. TBBPA1]|uniref:hypothetical protein n=1 Tax=Dehalobacter sp. TBBPA1 TaxID=3235037 RepID=UPI0034A172B1